MMANLIKKFLFLFLALELGVFAAIPDARGILLPNGKTLKLRLALDKNTQEKGLSGVRPKDFSTDEGMLFYYSSLSRRQFWMPDTYMNLTIVFLDEDLKIVHMENMQAQPGELDPKKIKRTPAIIAQHVLELRADSPVALNLKIGDQLKLITSH